MGGYLASRRLHAPPSGVRPTADRVRESIFARLGDPPGTQVLDVFAGTGALGIESLSRGAEFAVFVDSSARSLAVLRRNLSSLELNDCSRVLRSGAAAGVRRLGREGCRFDLAFMDPPYQSDLLEPTLRALVESEILSHPGTVVVETSTRHPVEPVDGLSTIDERRYGDTLVTRMQVVRS